MSACPPKMATRSEKEFGLKATLMRMQAAHELAEARAREDEIVVEAARPTTPAKT